MTKMIEKHGGVAHNTPAMREVSLDDHRQAVDFAHRLITGDIGIAIFLTGVGFRYLLEAIERQVDRKRYLDALSDIVTIARGPKTVAAMKDAGLTPSMRVPEPNTWRDLLVMVDKQLPVANQAVAIQAYGKTNPSLIAGLEARGARVVNVAIYQWELPEETSQLEANVRRLADGEIDVVMFTSAHQVVNVQRMADRLQITHELMRQLAETVVVSIGPTTSETLRDAEWPVDVEPDRPKMGTMIAAAAARSREILQK